MHRTFRTSHNRRLLDMEGVWDFLPDPQDRGVTEGWYERFPTEATDAWVPGVWNTQRAFFHYEGPAWYRRRFMLSACPGATLHFAGVTHQANVWLDGEPLGEHYGGFLPFSFLLLRPEPGEHELVVRVDNTHDLDTTIPSANLDWCRYGGIPRPVWVEELTGEGAVRSLRLAPDVRAGVPYLRVRAELANLRDSLLDSEWRLTCDGQVLRHERIQLGPRGSDVIAFGLSVPGAELWSPRHPALSTFRLEFAGDDAIERTGFREIAVAGAQVLLNGEPLVVRGINRHEDHPEWGFALPQHLMLRDLELLSDLGVNAIRGAHYPNDQRMLDLCDERGLLFIEEIPLWGFGREQLAQELIAARAAAMAWAMVERDINHPCIWAWSVLNECATDTAVGRMVVEQLVEAVRASDADRLITYASDRGVDDLCYDLVDIVCLNAYIGWYRHDLTWDEFLERMRAKVGDKPLLITEFGAGGLYGSHALEAGVLWSEEHQRQVLLEALQAFGQRQDLLGYLIWQFCDTRSDWGERVLRRPRSYNNKGLVNEHRQPKLAYEAVRAWLAAERERASGQHAKDDANPLST